MVEVISVSDSIAIARSDPDPESFKELAAKGFRSVVNLQLREEKQKIPEEIERQLASEAGLDYAHVPVSAQNLNEQVIDHFREEIERLPKPVLVHCASGKRAGAAAMMYFGVKENRGGQETLDHANTIGLDCGTQQLDEFVKTYVDRHHADD